MGLAAGNEAPLISLAIGRRHDRQELAGWSQARLAKARVVVVGAGATGNEVIKNLVLIGVGTILVVDFDVVAPSNLARCVFFRDADVGRPKADTIAMRAMEANPSVRVIPLNGDIEGGLGEQYLRDADVVVGCVDNAYARYLVNRLTRAVGRGWIDTAIAHDAAQVTTYGSRGACYACGLGERTLRQLRERFSCTGYRRVNHRSPVPTTAVTSSLAGSLAASLVVETIHGHQRGATRWTLLLGQPRLLVDELTESTECRFHGLRVPRAIPLGASADVSWLQLLDYTGWPKTGRLLPDQQLVSSLTCPGCGATRRIAAALAQVQQEQALCNGCQTVMEPHVEREIAIGGDLEEVSLSQLGYAPGSWLRIRIGRSVRTYSLPTEMGWNKEG